MIKCDLAVIGAGPYGLSAAAHLRGIAGLDVRVFGEPMESWKDQMPEGMLLRSPRAGSNLSDPASRLTLDAFCAVEGKPTDLVPIPLDHFVKYGLWFQRRLVPEIDRRRVRCVGREAAGFRLTLA